MPLPHLRHVPALQPLLAPGEDLVYTPAFHPFRGWFLLVPGLLLLIASHWWSWMIFPAVALILLWQIPFRTNQIAVTTERLLLRVGSFKMTLETIDNADIESWSVKSNLLTNILGFGTVIIAVNDGGDLRHVVLKWIWHPVRFVEALETLQVDLRRAAGLPDGEGHAPTDDKQAAIRHGDPLTEETQLIVPHKDKDHAA